MRSPLEKLLDPYHHVYKALRAYRETIAPSGEDSVFLNVLNTGVFVDVRAFQRAAVDKCLEIVSDLERFNRHAPGKRAARKGKNR